VLPPWVLLTVVSAAADEGDVGESTLVCGASVVAFAKADGSEADVAIIDVAAIVPKYRPKRQAF